jgi:hypothetical protein
MYPGGPCHPNPDRCLYKSRQQSVNLSGESRDPVGIDTFCEGAFQRWFHDHVDPSAPPRQKNAVGTLIGMTESLVDTVQRF